MRTIYFDHNATTPLRPEIKDFLTGNLDLYGNASSMHHLGRQVRTRIEAARESIKRILHGDDGDLIFTSGGSESNNIVLKGMACSAASYCGHASRHIITTAIEHPSVLETCRCLETMGTEVTYLPVDGDAIVDPDDVRRAIRANTTLISIMFGNNEVGSIQPIAAIGRIAREHGIPFHTDAVQVVGKIPIDVMALGIDFLSLSGHKIHAPKGVGALYVKSGLTFCPLIHGGHQERQRRAGTENTLGILALGKALELAAADIDRDSSQVAALRDRLQKGLLDRIEAVRINGSQEHRLPGTLNVSFRYVEGESVLLALDALGICVSTGSACSSGSSAPSHVLQAMGVPMDAIHGSIRFSLGWGSTEEDVDSALALVPGAIQRLRSLSPLQPGTGRG
ncbi:aminotransferase class V-fold PLP-dependent enzyme [bacterium]|nr:aminotransferase class V-fold PLP-dependent enzyme [candidate division CSSED10-310 bacterium]